MMCVLNAKALPEQGFLKNYIWGVGGVCNASHKASLKVKRAARSVIRDHPYDSAPGHHDQSPDCRMITRAS
jgi:hypothetical protein